jgi:hypothetical protein
VIGLLLLLLLLSIGLDKVNTVGTTTDEFGYLYGGAIFSGMDWNSVMQYHPYYSPFISILWTPLFYLFKDSPILLYQSIIGMNVMMVLVTYTIIYYISKYKIFRLSSVAATSLAFVVCIYPSNMYYVPLAVVETLLQLLFWLLLIEIYSYLNNYKSHQLYLSAVILGLMINVHNRTLAISLITIAFLTIVMIIKKQKLAPAVISLMIFIGFYLLSGHLKAIYLSQFEQISEMNSVNTSIPTVELLISIISRFVDVFKSFLGKIYALLTVGNVAVFLGIYKLVLDFLSGIKKWKEPSVAFLISAYLLIVFFGNVVAFSITTAGVVSRFDYVLYTRYFDNLVGPIMLIGMKWLLDIRKIPFLPLIWQGIALIVLTPTIMHSLEQVTGSIFAIDSSPGFGAFFPYYLDNQHIYLPLLKSICYSLCIILIYVLLRNYDVVKLRKYSCLSLLPLCLYWVFLGLEAKGAYGGIRDAEFSKTIGIVNILGSLHNDNIVYLRNTEDDFISQAKRLQVLCPNIPIKVETITKEFEPQDNTVYVTSTSDELYSDLSSRQGLAIHDYNGVDIYEFEDD